MFNTSELIWIQIFSNICRIAITLYQIMKYIIAVGISEISILSLSVTKLLYAEFYYLKPRFL